MIFLYGFYYAYNVGGRGAVRTSRPPYRNIFIHDYPFLPTKNKNLNHFIIINSYRFNPPRLTFVEISLPSL